MWPSTARQRGEDLRDPAAGNARAISTAAAPLAPSQTSVAAAAHFLPVRSTLVAPILPEPILRTSPAPDAIGEEQAERDRAQQIAERQGCQRDGKGQGRDHGAATMTGFRAANLSARARRRNTHSPPTKVMLRAALEFAAFEGGVAGARMQRALVQHKGLVRHPAAPGRRARPWPACRRSGPECAPASAVSVARICGRLARPS